MRQLTFFALVGIFLVSQGPLPTYGFHQDQFSIDHPNYVVIGAFRYHKNAVRFTSNAVKTSNVKAKFELNSFRQLYYVYVLSTKDREYAIAEARRLRDESEFKDTWVFSGTLGKQADEKGQPSAYAGVDINPVTEEVIEHPLRSQDGAQQVISSSGPSPAATDVALASNSSKLTANTLRGTSFTQTVVEDDTEGKKFFFKLYRATDQQTVEGDVDVISPESVRKIGTYKGNMDVKVNSPSGTSASISAVCEVFGYRKMQRELDYKNPQGDGIELSPSGSTVVPFELIRLQKGDIAIMYNVYFFKDAAVMRPESRFEVNSLLEMLKENEKYKIRIHGHTNGKASGKIIYVDEGSTNFFSLSKTKEGFGSAKKLSEERASVIRNFLISNGIDGSRMDVRAWGGKRPIHDKHSTRAQENVRVEIEILED